MPRLGSRLESECGVPIANESQALAHSIDCCSVGRVQEVLVCGSCGQPLPRPAEDEESPEKW